MFQGLSLSAHCAAVGLCICSQSYRRKYLWWWPTNSLVYEYSRMLWGVILWWCFFVIVGFSIGSWTILSQILVFLSSVEDFNPAPVLNTIDSLGLNSTLATKGKAWPFTCCCPGSNPSSILYWLCKLRLAIILDSVLLFTKAREGWFYIKHKIQIKYLV